MLRVSISSEFGRQSSKPLPEVFNLFLVITGWLPGLPVNIYKAY
jgi:hypothetical protein